MQNPLPVQWKETLENIKDKAGHLLEKFSHAKETGIRHESLNEDMLPAFMQSGGPPLDMHETADELIITAEVPGLKKDDFQLELVGGRLVIRGEKKSSRELRGAGGSYLSECSYGSFSRSVQLPYGVKDASIKADLKSGVLTIRMPKPNQERKQPYRLTIT